jgi:hypothetical protein
MRSARTTTLLDRYRRLTFFLPAAWRERLFWRLPRRFRDRCWADLERETGVSRLAPLVEDELERLRGEQ